MLKQALPFAVSYALACVVVTILITDDLGSYDVAVFLIACALGVESYYAKNEGIMSRATKAAILVGIVALGFIACGVSGFTIDLVTADYGFRWLGDPETGTIGLELAGLAVMLWLPSLWCEFEHQHAIKQGEN